MKKNINIFFAITALLLAMAGCGAKPTAPAHTNLSDPDNPGFQEPGVVLTAGPAEGSTVTNNDQTFYWSGTGSASLYSYSLDDPLNSWSSWSADTHKVYSNLSEGYHTFMVRAADAGGYEGDTIRYRHFTVNEINNTVLMYPATQTVAVGETASVWCEMEDMATPVSGVRLLIYVSNPSYLDTAGARADTGYHWRSRGGTPVGPFFNYYGANYLDVSLGVAGGTPAGVVGSGRIFKIKARAVAAGTMYMYIYSITARDTLNNPVTTNNPSTPAYIYISGKKEGAK